VTIGQLEHKFPNGLHDSNLIGLAVDFASGSACITLDVDCDDPNPEIYIGIKLRLTGLSLFVVEPPDVRIPLLYDGSIDASGYETSDDRLHNLKSYREHAPAGSFFYSFFRTNGTARFTSPLRTLS
jgi:hypothetical protein